MTTLAAFFITQTLSFNLPPGLLDSLCYVESKHIATKIHHDDGGTDSIGLCQVKLETARWMGYQGTYAQLLDPEVNSYFAAKYLSYQINRYHGDVVKAIIAYNRGSASSLTSSAYSDKVLKQWGTFLNEQ